MKKIIILHLILTTLLHLQVGAEVKYQFYDLGLLCDSSTSFALDINDNGWVVGGFYSKGTPEPNTRLYSVRPIIWSPTRDSVYIPELIDENSTAVAINNKNLVMGLTNHFGWLYNTNKNKLTFMGNTRSPISLNDYGDYCTSEYTQQMMQLISII